MYIYIYYMNIENYSHSGLFLLFQKRVSFVNLEVWDEVTVLLWRV